MFTFNLVIVLMRCSYYCSLSCVHKLSSAANKVVISHLCAAYEFTFLLPQI
jgi:hypothetical protein